MNNGPVCPECNGLGRRFFQIADDKRVELACPQCGGSGCHADALYREMSGEADADSTTQNFGYYWSRKLAQHYGSKTG